MRLYANVARLLVDVPVPLALLAVLEETGDGHDENHVDTWSTCK